MLGTLTLRGVAQDVSYPLDVGTSWQWTLYQNTNSRRVEITRDTLASNGFRYSIIPGYWSIPERWERRAGTQVYRYEPGSGKERLVFDFSKSPGDTINRSPYVVMYSATMDTLFGTIRRTWGFNVGVAPGVIDAGAVYIITDSLGLTDYSDFNSWLRVTGAIVDSRVYGTVTGMITAPGIAPGPFMLCQNFPNPFNPTTTIRYALPVRTHVMVSVYNTLGQQVAMLVNGIQDAGYHDTRFDGSGLASGVYIYRLRAGRYADSNKLLIIR